MILIIIIIKTTPEFTISSVLSSEKSLKVSSQVSQVWNEI